MRLAACTPFFLAAALAGQVPAGIDEAYFKGDPKTIMAACADRARAIKPNDSRLLAEYGQAYLTSGDRAKAEEAFAAAAKSDPKDGETYRLIGLAWLRMGHKTEALAALAQMQQMDPKAKNAFCKAAVNLLEAGLEAEAEPLMEKAWKLDPKDWQNCAAFARVALKARKAELGARWCARTVEARPKEERMWNELALAFAEAGALSK